MNPLMGMNDYYNKYVICNAFMNYFNLKPITELGKGTAGLVFKVEEIALEKKYPPNICLKIMPINVFKDGEYDIARRITEENTTNNIVKHYDKLYFDNFVGLVQEYVDGGNLADYVGTADQPVEKMRILNEMEIRSTFMDILHGIKEVHRRNLIHRDLKPENILVQRQEDGTLCLKIADFGYVRQMNSSGLAQTLCGTPHHMCPEQLNQESDYTIFADIWSLGVLFFRLIFHNYPFPAQSFFELLHKVMTSNISDLYKTVPHPSNVIVPPWAYDIIVRCLERDPSKRPTSEQLYNEVSKIGISEKSNEGSNKRISPLVQQRSAQAFPSSYCSSSSSSSSPSFTSPACSSCHHNIPLLSLVHPKSITCSVGGHTVCFACIRELFTAQLQKQRGGRMRGVSLFCVMCDEKSRQPYHQKDVKDMLSVKQYEEYVKAN